MPKTTNITYKNNIPCGSDLNVQFYGNDCTDITITGSGRLVELSHDDAMAFALSLIEHSKEHINPHELTSHHEAMIADAKARILPKPAPEKPQGYQALTPQARVLLQHMRRAGSISHREAMNDYGISGGALSRRMVDMEEAGFKIERTRKKHPITQRLYTRYSLAG